MIQQRKLVNCLLTWVFVLGVLIPAFSKAAVHNEILLDIESVKLMYDQPNVKLVDGRSYVNFKKSHIKGAVSVPVDETFAKSGRSDLVATVTVIRDLMSKAGIQSDSKVIIYGDKNLLNISRLFWVFETFGVRDVSIMNDSLTSWKKKKYPTESGEQSVTASVIYPSLDENKLATMLMVFAAMDKEEESLIDARTKAEYKGEHSTTGVFGHIPTAINIPWETNFTEGYARFKPVDELRELYKGLEKKKMNTVYCNKGKESAAAYVALRLLGRPVRAYDGSWYEWSLQDGLPVEKGF